MRPHTGWRIHTKQWCRIGMRLAMAHLRLWRVDARGTVCLCSALACPSACKDARQGRGFWKLQVLRRVRKRPGAASSQASESPPARPIFG